MDLLDYSDEIYLDRNEYGNHIYYKDKAHFNELGNYRLGMSLFSNLIKNYKIY